MQTANSSCQNNFGLDAGGIIYATSMEGINVTCVKNNNLNNSLSCGSPLWQNNTVGTHGYGSELAFPAFSLQTDLPPSLTYVSNGIAKMPIRSYATDQLGNTVTPGNKFCLVLCCLPCMRETLPYHTQIIRWMEEHAVIG